MSAAAARRRKQLLLKKQQNVSEDQSESRDPVSLRLQALLQPEEEISASESVAYEALQLAQSQIRRLVKLHQTTEALDLAFNVSMVLLEKKRRMVSVTSQLLGLMADVLIETNTICTEELVNRLEKINVAYKKALKEGYSINVEKDKEEVVRLQRLHLLYLKKITRWSVDCGSIKYGHLKLHSLLGDQCWIVGCESYDEDKESNVEMRADSITHFALAENTNSILALLKTLPKPTASQEQMGRDGGTAAERDCLLTRAVLVFITLENLRDANSLLRSYCNEISHDRDFDTLTKSYMNKTDGFAPSHIMFSNMLLQVCEKDRAGPLFQWLLRSFAQDLTTMKPDVKAYTSKIGRIYFGIMPPPSMLNMMENMMSMMGGAGAAGQMPLPMGAMRK